MTTITVQQKEFSDHFQCDVQLKDERGAKNFTVTVQKADYEHLTGGRVSPEALVKKSFEFLLEREPKESILSRFDLMLIGRYFPEYEREIKNRL